MLPRYKRLVSKSDFKKVQVLGRSFKGSFLKIAALPTSHTSQVGVIVSNKVSKKATARNRIKRTIRSFIEDNIDTLDGMYKIVVIAHPASLGANKEELVGDLETLFSKIK